MSIIQPASVQKKNNYEDEPDDGNSLVGLVIIIGFVLALPVSGMIVAYIAKMYE